MSQQSFDGTTVQIVPQNVEKLPLYHWRPGARLLSFGSRSGARFDGLLDSSEAQDFRRPLTTGLITASQEKMGTAGIVATWSTNWHYPNNLAMLWDAALGDKVLVGTAPQHTEQIQIAERYLPQADAWVWLWSAKDSCDSKFYSELVDMPRHCELVIGCDGPIELPAMPWHMVKAVHIVAAHPHLPVHADYADWEQALLDQVPQSVASYAGKRQHSYCPHCQTELVWRSSGRSRLEALQWNEQQAVCTACGNAVDFFLSSPSN